MRRTQTNTIGSKGDGAWIMQRCAYCLQGTCTYSFEGPTPAAPQSVARTVFELSCPALERFDDVWLDQARLSDSELNGATSAHTGPISLITLHLCTR